MILGAGYRICGYSHSIDGFACLLRGLQSHTSVELRPRRASELFRSISAGIVVFSSQQRSQQRKVTHISDMESKVRLDLRKYKGLLEL